MGSRFDRVTLTTEVRSNVALYEHFGYRILGHDGVDELRTWMISL